MISDAWRLFLIKEAQIVIANKWHLWILSLFFLPMMKISLGPYYYVSNSNPTESFTLCCHIHSLFILWETLLSPLTDFSKKQKKNSLLSLPYHAHSKLNPFLPKKNKIPWAVCSGEGPSSSLLLFACQHKAKERGFIPGKSMPSFLLSFKQWLKIYLYYL